MIRSHVTMILICKHSCAAGATSNKENFFLERMFLRSVTWKMRTRRNGKPGGRSALQAVTFLWRESLHRCATLSLGVFEQMRTRRRQSRGTYCTRPETFASLSQNGTSITPSTRTRRRSNRRQIFIVL